MGNIRKKGWLRIVEVTLAIVLIIGSVFIFYQDRLKNSSDDISNRVQEAYNLAIKNDSLREQIFNAGVMDIPPNGKSMTDDEEVLNKALIREMNRTDITTVTRICEVGGECKLYHSDKKSDIYSTTELVATGKLNVPGKVDGIPRKVRIYAWRTQ